MQIQPQPPAPEKRSAASLYAIAAASILSLLFIFSLSSLTHPSPPLPSPRLFPTHLSLSLSSPPSLAYLLSGSSADASRLLRLLSAVYHPNNHYLLHLDRSASHSDRRVLARMIGANPLYREAQNVDVIGKADFSYRKGSSPLAAGLHGASILLRIAKKWDWFVSLSADDYPLVTQDDLLHILSYLPKDLNFVNHTSYIGWRESRSLKRIIVDPGLYLSHTSWMFYATQKRNLPDAFRLFMGSSSAILSRQVIEFAILGTDNFPRTFLMYLSNTPSSASIYFPTLLCNSNKFNKTIINHSLHYASVDSDHRAHPLKYSDFENLIKSGSAFASPFIPDDPVLDLIDREILGRSSGKPVPGGWCLGESENDTCNVWGDAQILRPGPGAKRLERLFVDLLSNGTFRSHQCVVE